MLGDTGSILTMAGAEPRQTDGERTTEEASKTPRSVLDLVLKPQFQLVQI